MSSFVARTSLINTFSITSPRTFNKNENVSVLLRHEKTSNDYVFSKLLYETLEISTQPVPSPHFGIDNLVKFDIVGSSNGLVCLLGLFPSNIVVWIKLFSIGPLMGIDKPLGFWKNDSMFLGNDESQLVFYD